MNKLLQHLSLVAVTTASLLACSSEDRQEKPTKHVSNAQDRVHKVATKTKQDVAATLTLKRSISERISDIKKVYGIEVHFSIPVEMIHARIVDTGNDPDAKIIKTITKEYIAQLLRSLTGVATENALSLLEKRLQIYPPIVLKNWGPAHIYLIEGDTFKIGEVTYDFRDFTQEGGNNIVLFHSEEGKNLNDNITHEIFHALDQHTQGDWSRDNGRWKETSTLMNTTNLAHPLWRACIREEVLTFSNASEAFRNGLRCREAFRIVLKGYTDTYGYIFEEDTSTLSHVENKAVFGAMVLHADKDNTTLGIRWMVERAQEDKQVLTKLQLITGCSIIFTNTKEGIRARFTRLLTAQEYAALVTKEGMPVSPTSFDFYRKWSTDEKGHVHMGPDFYNAILDEAYNNDID